MGGRRVRLAPGAAAGPPPGAPSADFPDALARRGDRGSGLIEVARRGRRHLLPRRLAPAGLGHYAAVLHHRLSPDERKNRCTLHPPAMPRRDLALPEEPRLVDRPLALRIDQPQVRVLPGL